MIYIIYIIFPYGIIDNTLIAVHIYAEMTFSWWDIATEVREVVCKFLAIKGLPLNEEIEFEIHKHCVIRVGVDHEDLYCL